MKSYNSPIDVLGELRFDRTDSSEYILMSFNVFLQGVRNGTGENRRCHLRKPMPNPNPAPCTFLCTKPPGHYLHVCISPVPEKY